MVFSSTSPRSLNRQAVRSISLPTRSHPSTLLIEEELASFKIWEASNVVDVQSVCNGLTNVDRLYKCVDNLLNLPLTKQTLSHKQNEKFVDELRDRSMRLLDMCDSVKDVVTQYKEHVRDVQSAFRRRKGDFIVYSSLLKKLVKDAKKSVVDLKQIDHTYASKPLNLDHTHLCSTIKVLGDVSEASVFVFGILLSFLSVSISKPKSATKWSIVSKFMHKGATGIKDQQQVCVEALDCNIESIEDGLECMFRRLIRIRASLLNILS